ncbi:DUF4402 domain-containing protein [Phenylobacterium soli]|uniref:DUF4402 domain-containing protein n=1 Tax=Phenylobacterium soli TaxID=2170551 RepID=A0A328AJR5_9CAUL|nr:DUF4402 domain-containing protein [Phenylobacterium soli]RAK55193.1 hypothetical protein DJ017_12005 [Phenylobacterium soli]
MKRSLLLAVAAVGAFAGCAQALAAVTAQGAISLSVDQRAGIDIISPLVLPTVSTTAVVPVSRLTTVNSPSVSGNGVAATAVSSTGASGPSLGNATLTIYGQSGDAVSMAVPETFKVIRTGGTETLTVKTNTNSEYDLAGNGVVLGGGLNADTMSVNVGGKLAMASADQAVPGPYEGLLVVVVQYN